MGSQKGNSELDPVFYQNSILQKLGVDIWCNLSPGWTLGGPGPTKSPQSRRSVLFDVRRE